MNGKIVKISSNDLYGNVDDRQVAIFAAFNHTKYMNKYAIFTFVGEYQKNKLYYGSIHKKDNSLVIFSVSDNAKQFIEKFIEGYLNNTLDKKEYEIINIDNITKAELISYNEKDVDYLETLDQLSIPKPEVHVEETTSSNKKNTFLYILLVIMILLLLGVTYLYFFPEQFKVELNKLTCTKDDYDIQLAMKYNRQKTVKFDRKNKFKITEAIDIYTFNDEDTYTEFKNNNKQDEYFHITGSYKYDDNTLSLKIIYQEESIIDNFDDMKKYLIKEGYTCEEGKYYE